MKKLISALLALILLFASCFAESGVDLDDLLAEIDAEAEIEKRTDMICLPTYSCNAVFYTTADRERSMLITILNYKALKEVMGTEPEISYNADNEYFDFTAELLLRGEEARVRATATPKAAVPRSWGARSLRSA